MTIHDGLCKFLVTLPYTVSQVLGIKAYLSSLLTFQNKELILDKDVIVTFNVTLHDNIIIYSSKILNTKSKWIFLTQLAVQTTDLLIYFVV